MAVAGPSQVTVDLTLDSENRLFHPGTSAAGSDFIDLTLDSDDYLLEHRKNVASSDPYHASVIVIDDDDDDEIQASTQFRAKSSSALTKIQELELFDDEFPVIMSSSPIASSSNIAIENSRKTEYLTEVDRESLSCTEFEAPVPEYSEEDERLARQLAREEEESFNQLIETIENNKDGIVFSVVVNVEDSTLEDGSPAHPDDLERFSPWKKLCEQSGLKVAKFHWFVNYELEKRFEIARDMMEAIMGERPPEMQLFHGTQAANIDLILQGGFKIGGVGGHPISHGTSMGYGIYLGAAAATSLAYAIGGNKIFACRVIPGRTTKVPIHQPPPSVYVGSEDYECYDGGASGVFVHRYASLVLPCYMIEFDIPQPQYNNMGVPGLGAALGSMFGVGMFGAGMPLAGAFPPPLALALPVAPIPRSRRVPRKVKPPPTDAAPTARKRTRKTAAEAEGGAETPRKRLRRTQLAQEEEEEEAPPPPSSRKGKMRQK